MADYHTLIARAIDGLADKSPTTRQAVYERARRALIGQLQTLQPPVAPADIERERAALDLAISSVEAQHTLPSQQSPMETHAPLEPSQVLLEPINTTPAPIATPSAALADIQASREVEPINVPEDDPQSVVSSIVERPRIGSRHNSSGQANRVRAIILVASVFAVVIGIASYKLYNREQQATVQALVDQQNSEQTPEAAQSDTGKFTDRLGGSVAETPVQQTSATGTSETIAVQQAFLFEADPSTAQLPPNAQKIIASPGLTKWSLEQMDGGSGLPMETVARGEVDLQQLGVKLDMQIRKSNDGSAVSHTIVMRFTHRDDDVDHQVVSISKLEMKDQADDAIGNALKVFATPVAPDFFILGLSDIPAEVERNMQFLQSKNWLLIDVIFSNGQRGTLAIEKGSTGFQVIADAIRNWQ